MVSEHASPLATLGGVDAGGQNVHVAALAAALVKRGHAVTVYTRRDRPELPARVTMAPGVVVEHLDAGPACALPKDAIYPHVPALADALGTALRREQPDVVHAHFWMSGLAALGPAKALGIPLVQTFHALGSEKRRFQGADDPSPPARLRKEARLAREVDAIVATSRAEVFELLRMGAHQRAIAVVPCGVDVNHFTPGGARETRTPDRMRIVTLSRLVPRKGIDTVIEALARVPGAELVVAGGAAQSDPADDAQARSFAESASRLGVAPRVHFRGPVTRAQVPALLRSADVVACTPWYEPFGIVPLEAMACGVPVVVSAVGGLVDTVVDGVTGVHVPPRDAARLASALCDLRDDPYRRLTMARASLKRVRARYSWHRVAGDTLAVYQALLAARGTALALGS